MFVVLTLLQMDHPLCEPKHPGCQHLASLRCLECEASYCASCYEMETRHRKKKCNTPTTLSAQPRQSVLGEEAAQNLARIALATLSGLLGKSYPPTPRFC